jgi:hypothetical protein
VHDAGAPAVRLGPAETQRVDVLAGDGAHDVGAGDEDAPVRPEHDDVGQRRPVGRATSSGPQHED